MASHQINEKNNQVCNGCTCGPYPEIDLTRAYLHSMQNDMAVENEEKWISETREKVLNACRQYGCFHVSIDVSNNCDILSTLQGNRNGSSASLDDAIEEWFDQNFLRQTVAAAQQTGNEKGEEIPDIFDAQVTPPSCCHGSNDALKGSKISLVDATYRGRNAESGDGDAKAAKSEPKQSWEFRRCRRVPATNGKTLPEHTAIASWVDDLHSIAVSILRILNLPPIFLREQGCCSCCGAPDAPSSLSQQQPSQKNCCCVDLLRVFRYDSVQPHEQLTNPGSSPHSDWGTMTIVWQDAAGGLQMYCHSHQTWNDVEIVKDEAKNEKQVLYFFVHVGDFLSLATTSSSSSAMNKTVSTRWPSPRHRVLCPINSKGDNADRKRDKRASLVYFAYPPPGVTLNEARDAFQKSSSASQQTDHMNYSCCESDNKYGQNAKEESFMDIPFDFYSLLHNQSYSQSSITTKPLNNEDCIGNDDNTAATSSKRYFERILNVPFDDVIREKWGQVQRG